MTSGSATVSSPSATSVLISQSSRTAILHWSSFSIGAGNTVRFENGSGATLNRVTGLSRSQIDGALTATGSVYLVNPNGITVGPTGTITTGGNFIASTHDVSDAEFSAGGTMTFRGSSTASVINYGSIGALGGDVALIARAVENAGTLTAPNGTAALAAGYEVLVRDTALAGGKFVVKVGGADTQAKTSGIIKAAEVELKANGGNVYALAGNTDSVTKATGVATKGGRIFLTAGDGGSVEVRQKLSARGPQTGGKAKGGAITVAGNSVTLAGPLDAAGESDRGGQIAVTAQTLASSATLDASGTIGGAIDISAGNITSSGTLTAAATTGSGGQITLSAGPAAATQDGVIDLSGLLDASSSTGAGGSIAITGRFVVPAGTLMADGMSGGTVSIEAGAVTQSGTITANGSGEAGGTVRISALHSLIQTASALTAANSLDGTGGTIDLIGTSGGSLFSSGTVTATGRSGGIITTVGTNITLAAARFDASGTMQGGTVHIGGGLRGAGSQTAATALVNGATTLRADATSSGNGGEIVVWSETSTTFFGSASARGGQAGGNGGMIELSSGETLTFQGVGDAGAAAGQAGTLLLDPKNIVISDAQGGLATIDLIDPNAGLGSRFGQMTAQLSNGTIVVTKPYDEVGGAADAGSVFFYDSSTGALIATFQGSHAGDKVGLGNGGDSYWGGTGLLFLDQTGGYDPTTSAPLYDGSKPFLIVSHSWNDNRGAITWVGANGTVNGIVSAANSLVGANANDRIGSYDSVTNTTIDVLSNGNYVVNSPNWSNDRGALTFGTATAGVTGLVSAANSILGSLSSADNGDSRRGDMLGSGGSFKISNGNRLILSPNWNRQGGAITFLNVNTGFLSLGVLGSANSIIGAGGSVYTATNTVYSPQTTVYGFYGGDNVGASTGNIWELANGNIVFVTPNWGHGRGAATVFSGTTGMTGSLSASNSLVGVTKGTGDTTDSAGDQYYLDAYGRRGTYGGDAVGSEGITLLDNGGFVVRSSHWGSNKGAVTFFNASTSSLSGTVTAANSLVGATAGATYGYDSWHSQAVYGGDQVGTGVTALSNGNYVVNSIFWNGGFGAVTVVSGTTGRAVVGSSGSVGDVVTTSNSLTGDAGGDSIGNVITELVGTSDFVASSYHWHSGRGAVTKVSGTSGMAAVVSSSNSLVGTTAYETGSLGGDQVGSAVRALSTGGWVILSPTWNKQRGAVTFVAPNGTISGTVSAANSLVGSTGAAGDAVYCQTCSNGFPAMFGGDQLGSAGIFQLTNGNFLIRSPEWNGRRGALTFVDGTTGTMVDGTGPLSGTVSATNSLVGSNAGDIYVSQVHTANWNSVDFRYYVGGDQIGASDASFDQLATGDFLVRNWRWNSQAGAITYGTSSGKLFDGSNFAGTVGAGNSLVGSTSAALIVPSDLTQANRSLDYNGGDRIGSGVIKELPNNNFLIFNAYWSQSRGAVTLGLAGGTNIWGAISSSNSLVGTTAGDQIGYSGEYYNYTLSDGSLILYNPYWNGSAGALTWITSTSSVTGEVSASNSLVGTPGENIADIYFGITQQSDGSLFFASQNASGNAGAVTWLDGPSALIGSRPAGSTFFGNSALASSYAYALKSNTPNALIINLAQEGTGRVVLAFKDTTGWTYARAAGSTLTIAPSLIAQALNSGTSLILQANNDITIDSAILANLTSTASLTLHAGRSILGHADIALGNGSLTLLANDSAANGVVDQHRDPGNATIAFDATTTLSTGSGTVSITLANSTDKTHNDAGDIVLGAIHAASVTVQNLGSPSGSLTLGGAISASSSGTSILLATRGAFINNTGESALAAGAGRWLVYSATSAGNSFGNLDSGNTAVWNTAVGGSVSATGNRYVFAQQPVLTVTTTDSSKTYGNDASAQLQTAYTVTGQAGIAHAYLGDTTGFYTGSPDVTSTGSGSSASVQPGGYAISASIGSMVVTADGYAATPVFVNSGKLTVNARPITVTADAQSMTYGNSVPSLTYTVGGDGLVNGDSLTGGLATSATAASGVGTYAIAQGTLAGSANYAISYTGANVSVTARPITITATAQSMTYGDAVPGLGFTVGGDGLVNGDNLFGALTTSASPTSSVGAYEILQGSLGASSNYDVTYAGANVQVNARILIVTADRQSMVYGTTVPALTYSVGGAGLVNGDSLSGGLATSVSSTSDVGSYLIQQGSLTASGNYVISYVGADVSVTPRSVTVTADAQSMVYGNSLPVLTYTVSSGLLNGDSLTGALTTSAGATSAVGTYAIQQGSLAASSNYAISYTGANVTVTPRSVTVTADAQSMVYGNSVPILTYTVGGSGLVNGDSLTGALATSATANSGVGSYAIAQGTLGSTNYAVTYTGANVSVTARPITVTATAQSVTYGDSVPALTYAVGGDGLVNGDSLTGALATSASSNSGVGLYAITQGSLAASGNYALTYTGANVSVTTRALTVTADAQSMVYGNSVPVLSYTVGGSGLVNGDSLTGGLATSASSTSDVGSYLIQQGSLAASGNYVISYVGADVSVTPRSVTVTADAQSMVYGNSLPVLTYTVGGSGLVNGDTLAGALATSATSASDVGTYAILQGTLDAANYAISFTGADVSVTARPITVTASAQSMVYGDSVPELTYAVGGGLVNGDTLSGALSTAATASTPVGSYAIAQGTLAASPNYSVSFSGAQIEVTARPLIVTANPHSMVYGTAVPSLTYVVGGRGLVNGDSLMGMLAAEAMGAAAVGSYGILQGTLAASSNYALTYVPGRLTVLPAAGPQDAEREVVNEALRTVLIPQAPVDQWVQTSETAAVINETASGSETPSSSSAGLPVSGCGGATYLSSCDRAPHPANLSHGRWLTFQVR